MIDENMEKNVSDDAEAPAAKQLQEKLRLDFVNMKYASAIERLQHSMRLAEKYAEYWKQREQQYRIALGPQNKENTEHYLFGLIRAAKHNAKQAGSEADYYRELLQQEHEWWDQNRNDWEAVLARRYPG